MALGSAQYQKRDEVMMRMNESLTLQHPLKRNILYFILFALTPLLLTSFFSLYADWNIPIFTKKLVYIVIVLIVGICHVFSFPAWLHHLYEKQTSGLWYTALLGVSIGFLCYILFYSFNFSYPEWAFAAACSFLLPSAIQYSWGYFDALTPVKDFDPWFLPFSVPNKKASLTAKGIRLMIKIKSNYYDVEENSFNITVPNESTLGVTFHRFLIQQAEKGKRMEMVFNGQQPFAWKFFLLTPLGTKPLNPAATLNDNSLKQQDVILIERVKVS